VKKILVFACLLLSACTAPPVFVDLEPLSLQLKEGQTILVKVVGAGDVSAEGDADTEVRVVVQTINPEHTDFQVISTNDQIMIIVNYNGFGSYEVPIRLNLHAPSKSDLRIEADSATVTVKDFAGKLAIASVSGNILMEQVGGSVLARSNRGDVLSRNSYGTLNVVGNYGVLNIEDGSGDIGVSTIMGTIKFTGSIGGGDHVRLEADHGPIVVDLHPNSSLDLQVRSNSGEIVCMITGIESSLRSCHGRIGDGEPGELNIRTVSGPVTLQMIP
jgi:hypothetical protein